MSAVHDLCVANDARTDAYNETKARFAVRKNSRCTLTFDELYRRFEDPACAIGTVASDAGISRQAMWELYREYFLPLFETTGTDRLEVRNRQLSRAKEEKRVELENGPSKGRGLVLVAERAKRYGCTVKNVVVEGTSAKLHLSTRFLSIDKRVVALRHITAVFAPELGTKLAYSFATVSRSSLEQSDDIVVVVQTGGNPPRFFVVPTAIIKKRLFQDPSVKTVSLYIRQHDGLKKRMKLDLLDFEDDW